MRVLGGPGFSVGASAHSVEEARTAAEDGSHFIVFGPVYDTPSKRRWGAPQGVDRLAKVTANVRIPVIAIGGITPERVTAMRAAGAAGVAAIAAILDTASPADATKRFLDTLAAS